MGEAKRRREAAGAEGDPGFAEYRNHFKRHFPKQPERDIGEGWMRQYTADVDYGTPEEFKQPPGTVAMHVIFDDATLNAALWPADIDKAVAEWGKTGQSRQQTKDQIMGALLGNQHMQQQSGNAVACAALWLACNSEMAPVVRLRLAQAGAVMTYLIFDTGRRHPVDGRKEYTFRLMLA